MTTKTTKATKSTRTAKATKTAKTPVVEQTVETPVVEQTVEVLEAIDTTITSNEQVIEQTETVIVTKADISRKIWADELAKVNGDGTKLVRKNVIARLKNDPLFTENGLSTLTAAGAATYYQKMKESAGLVQHKAK